jgi:hypothetical protein
MSPAGEVESASKLHVIDAEVFVDVATILVGAEGAAGRSMRPILMSSLYSPLPIELTLHCLKR